MQQLKELMQKAQAEYDATKIAEASKKEHEDKEDAKEGTEADKTEAGKEAAKEVKPSKEGTPEEGPPDNPVKPKAKALNQRQCQTFREAAKKGEDAKGPYGCIYAWFIVDSICVQY